MFKDVNKLRPLVMQIILLIFFTILVSIYAIHTHNMYKQEIIRNNASIIGLIIEKYPNIEIQAIKEIISDDSNIEQGIKALGKYGIDDIENLDEISNINKLKNKMVLGNIIFVVSVITIYVLINLYFYKKEDKRLNDISNYINNILNNDYSLDIREYDEDSISALKNYIYKITIKLRNMSEYSQKEKEYLEVALSDISHQLKTPLTSIMVMNELLENKPLLFGIIGGTVLILALILTVGIVSSSKNSASSGVEVTGEPLKENIDLLTTDNAGKAIEIQALLAKYDIAVSRRIDGTKSILYLKKGDCKTGRKACYTTDRDLALMQIVQSGLMDQNVGLEIFDKGDFTSTKEDKKIRLSRAINGELSRLIRRIDGVDTASVFISIPEQTMFTSMQKPVTATVQLTLARDASKLDQLKIKAITNLLLGSVTGLTAENIAITDTNGNTYHSIMNAEDEMLRRLEENDKYMTTKVNQQLDRLIGQGNYVATV